MTGFLGDFLWAALRFVLVLVLHIVSGILWLCWPLVLAWSGLGLAVTCTQSAEAGWFSWLWDADNSDLNRALNVAQEAARVASQAAEAQAMQAAAQADQNSRMAEAVAQLSAERQAYAGHLRAISDSVRWDSHLAAAVDASGPVLVCLLCLAVAALALWLATRSGDPRSPELPGAVEVLLEELAAGMPEESRWQNQRELSIGRAGTPPVGLPLVGGGPGPQETL